MPSLPGSNSAPTRRSALAGLAAAAAVRPGPAGAAVTDVWLAGPLGDRWLGAPDAPVTVVEYAAVTCTHCAAFHGEAWPLLKRRWVETGQVRFVLRGYPLNPLDTAGFMLARAGGGGNYYPVTDLLFERQASWAFVTEPLDTLRALMRQAGFSRDRFDAVLRDQALYDGVNVVHARATADLGVHATPTLFVNGERHEGALPSEALDALVRKKRDGTAG